MPFVKRRDVARGAGGSDAQRIPLSKRAELLVVHNNLDVLAVLHPDVGVDTTRGGWQRGYLQRLRLRPLIVEESGLAPLRPHQRAAKRQLYQPT